MNEKDNMKDIDTKEITFQISVKITGHNTQLKTIADSIRLENFRLNTDKTKEYFLYERFLKKDLLQYRTKEMKKVATLQNTVNDLYNSLLLAQEIVEKFQ